MAKRALYTAKGRAMGLRELLDIAINKRSKLHRMEVQESQCIVTRKSKLSPAVRDILAENPIVYCRR